MWSDGGWTRVRAVVRHLHHGQIFRVGTGGGVVDVTDHSLLRADAFHAANQDATRTGTAA